jgi:hypothetical protein
VYAHLICVCLQKLGELTGFEDEDTLCSIAMSKIDNSVPRGRKFLLFFTSHNNSAESNASSLLSQGVRGNPPPIAAAQFLKVSALKLRNYQEECSQMDTGGQRLTLIGIRWFTESLKIEGLQLLSLQEVSPLNYVLTISKPGSFVADAIVVIESNGAHCNCEQYKMTHSICHHIRFSLDQLSCTGRIQLMELEKRKCFNNMFPPCLVTESVVNAAKSLSLVQVLPFGRVTLVATTDITFVPPRYQNSQRSCATRF